MSNSKETMTKKQQDDLASNFNNLPWGLPMGFPSMAPFGVYPPFGLPTSNFPSLNSFPTPPPLSSLLSTSNSTNSAAADVWPNGLSTSNPNIDYNEYAKQLGLLMNAFNDQTQKTEIEKSKTSPSVKSSKSKRTTPATNTSLASTNATHDKTSTSKTTDESYRRPTSTSSSASSRPSSSSNQKKSSHSKSSNTTASTKTPVNADSTLLDPLAFAAAAAAAAAGGGNLTTFPYFLPSLLSQPTGTNNNNNNNTATSYPFSTLSSSLMNPTGSLYPFLSPDWLTTSPASKLLEGISGSTNSKDSTSHQTSKSKQSQKHITPENKHSSTLNSLLNESLSPLKSKKRAKSIRDLAEEQELNRERTSPNNSARKSLTNNPSLLHSALIKSPSDVIGSSSLTSIDSLFKPILFDQQPSDLWTFKPIKDSKIDDTDSNNGNGLRENLLNLSRRSSNNDTPVNHSADESRSNDGDDSDPNPKRRKTDEVNEALVRIPLNRGWKRVTIVRAVTRTGVRGDVSYYAPCGRKLRSFQEIDRYLAKKNITDLDRSHFTFSSKVHIGHFHEPKEGPDGKTIFNESTEDEIVNRILELNPKFRRIKFDYESETPTKTSTVSSPSVTPSHHNGDNFQQIYEENKKLRLEQEEMVKRAAEINTTRETMRLLQNLTGDSSKISEHLANSQFQANEFLKIFMEQQKLVQQQELEHQQKLQAEQQEQERKRQELTYLKQLELKKRQEEKLLLIEQRKAEKNAEREKKIQEKYLEIVQAKEMKRIAEDMQLRDLKPLPTLKPVDNMRLSIEAFANSLMIIQFLNNFKHILHIPDNLIPTLNSLQQSSSSSSRDINSLCQVLLNIALEDPGIPNPKKCITNLGQKLSEIDINEHTFGEVLRLYIRERNGFDDKITQNLSDTSFQSLTIDDKLEILAFLCNDLSMNKQIVEGVDHNLDELIVLKHEKLEIEKRLRRLKFEKSNSANSNNTKKLAALIREKDMNSSDNESPDESDDDDESPKNDEDTTIISDPAADTADDQDIETIDETKIDDLDKRLTLVGRKYTLIKRRAFEKHSRTRALHLGQDRYRRRYWYFSHLPGIYVEGLTSGDICANLIKDTVENATKQKLDNTVEVTTSSRSTQRKKQQVKIMDPIPTPQQLSSLENSVEQSTPADLNKVKAEQIDNEEEEQQQNTSKNVTEDLSTMDLSAFCMATKQDDENYVKLEDVKDEQADVIKSEQNDEIISNNKRDLNDVVDNGLPLDLSCSKPKRSCEDDYWATQHTQAAHLLPPAANKYDQFHELNGSLASTSMLFDNIKQENILSTNILNFTNANEIVSPYDFSASVKQESAMNAYKQIEQTIREKYQYPQPLPIPEDVQSGWWCIQTPDELRLLIKSLAKRGQRERYLCRMLQRYFDVITHLMKQHNQSNLKNGNTSVSSTENEMDDDTHERQASSNDLNEATDSNIDVTHEMDVLNEIYNLSDRIISSSFQCRSYDSDIVRRRLSYSDIQAKGSDVLDEAKHLLTELERNIERRYLKHPFVRKCEINLSSLNRINQNSTYHHTLDNSTNEIVSSSKYDEVPQQLERWRRTVNESRTSAQVALCLTQLERCIAWERSILRVYCEICNSDDDEEKLLLCDGCDHGTHTYCFLPPMSSIPPNDWYCYVCIGKAKGENLCFVCGNFDNDHLNRCEHCGKLFHEGCLKNAKQQRGKWLCVLCAANDPSFSNGTTSTKPTMSRQTSRSINSRQTATASTTNGETNSQLPSTTTASRNRSNNNRKSKGTNHENLSLQESHSNSSHADTTLNNTNETSPMENNDLDDDMPSPIIGNTTNNNQKKKSSKKPKTNNDIKACRTILNELLKSDVSWPFQTPVDTKEHPEYYECIKEPMDFSTMKKKMRHNQYIKRDDFFHDIELILNNCEYYNEDDSPVGQAGHLLRTLFQSLWTKQFS
ncbi:unnamed protein product [Adineta ricciae]|uniref:Bromodomain adjacent to zinc finger domain protein 2B-like n=1 Tax=Adineta ricciae TaxID=249248 RepID=A0A816B8R3_ADIRI|nr:unnamed protein product [Adineta ricciae]